MAFGVLVAQDKVRALAAFAVAKAEELAQLETCMGQKRKSFGPENFLMVSTDSKKTKEMAIAICQEQGLTVTGKSELPKDRDSSASTQGKELPLIVMVSNGMNETGSEQVEAANTLLMINPKSIDNLLSSITWTSSSISTLITSHKDFTYQRNKLIQKFIDPIGLLKLLRVFKKNIGKPGLLKLNISDSMGWLGVAERSSLTWVIEELVKCGCISYIGVIPTLIYVEVISHNSSKLQNLFVREITSKAPFACGKFKIHPLSLVSVEHSLIEKLKAEPMTMLTREEYNQITFEIENFNHQLLTAKQQGLINVEVKEQILLTDLIGQLSEIDIQRIINRCWLQEKVVLNNVEFF